MCKSWGWITSIYYMVPWQNPISFLFLPPYSSGLCLVRAPLIGDSGIYLPPWPFHLLRQLLCSALEWVRWLHNMTMTDDYKFISFLAWLPMSFKLVGYCIICWCCNILLHFITVIYTCCCKSNYSAGHVPAVGSQVGRFVGTLNVSILAALESITDAPADRDVDYCHWAWTLGVTITFSKNTLPSWMG